MWRILVLGAISGLPWVFIGSALTLWLKESGESRSTIGHASLIFAVYSINFLWAPLVDRIRIPWLAERVGQRKAWILTLQAGIFICLLLWSMLYPTNSLELVITVGLAIAICSATQDINIDALRIEQMKDGESDAMAAGAAVTVVGWWTGYKLGGMLALFLAEYLQLQGHENYWQLTFLALLVLILAMNALLMLIPEVSWQARQEAQLKDQAELGSYMGLAGQSSFTTWIGSTIIAPFASFFRNNGVKAAVAILSFIFLFKIGEAFVGKMSIVFYKEMDFSKADIAVYSKGLGWVVTVVFTLIGGWFAAKKGIVKALMISGIAMAGTNLLFSLMAWVSEPSELLFATAVLVDDVTASIATVSFVTFISLLVDRTYTATQYALLASLGTLGRTLLAATSGDLVDALDGDWGTFFVITTFMVVPSLILLWYIRGRFAGLINNREDAAQANA